ncbi:Glutamine--fructose-6-phosphate aminotransferase [isomerizing] [Aquicella siphonis]|uniref:Glutamine--fructose-6-phosphate aminotransferase [isomerizing] n=1 Tax=Aquicella siphonis TaxID=254247 RepID=A0A5E4PLL7_9COXI|nr:glutamine--fructose-6-phosphate transaminase (isomerizing) [Aquicella siphonis]VVC77203.1 Glutamine--fructose-6-phosphate aminotransferase [isomerizing] [Aquicella siphonis]
MCGIIGAVGTQNVSGLLLQGLKRLEYRGYDSAGIAVISPNQQLQRIRTAGKVQVLIDEVGKNSLDGNTGIAHTRWATHGRPSENNAHPHTAGDAIAIVHNGIIENHESLRHRLLSEGCHITSDTDSELIAHLIHQKIRQGVDTLTAVRSLIQQLKGAYAIGVINKDEPGRLFATRFSSPLVIGLGEEGTFISSDTLALRPVATQVIYLEDGDVADITSDTVTIYGINGEKVNRPSHKIPSNHEIASKGKYPHYMLKEIFEQPDAMSRTIQSRMTTHQVMAEAFGVNAADIFRRTKRIQIIACGTSYHAGLVSKYWFEEIIRIPCEVEIASEYRYRNHIIEPGTLFITLSQSGETADTLAGLRLAKTSGYLATLSICNVAESSLVRESDLVLLIDAGFEIGVASTKSFTCQLEALFMLMIALGHAHALDALKETDMIRELRAMPGYAEEVLKLNAAIQKIAKGLEHKQNCFFIGRGIQFPVAMEGALKLKEISYIHAEAFPAGELKHGPIALIDNSIPIVALAPNDDMIGKMKSSLEEILSRGGNIVLLTTGQTGMENRDGISVIHMPHVPKLLAPIIYAIPLQLLAYHAAVLKGADIDQPRNLAKSVTVE